jgi:hypothetical protein
MICEVSSRANSARRRCPSIIKTFTFGRHTTCCSPVIDPKIGQGESTVMYELRQRAQGLVEYGLIIALVAVLAIAGLIIFGPAVSGLLSKLGGSV